MTDASEHNAKSDIKMSSALNDGTTLALTKLKEISDSVKDLDPALKERALTLLLESEFGPSPVATGRGSGAGSNAGVHETPQSSEAPQEFSALVELWTPDTQPEWALLAAYFLTRRQGEDTVGGQAMNTILKHHGKGIPNITKAVTSLIRADPALMLQVKKTGTAQQARKSYRVTTVGLRFVEDKLHHRGGSGA